jgi:uncharacterized membrane-anchored protein YhcB (DUF1043 family)
MLRQDSTSALLAVIVALSGAGRSLPPGPYGITKQREKFMTWEYALIGLVVGIIIGAVCMRFGNRKLRQQQALQYELEKNKAELEEYREELVSHFARSAELLDNMAHDYRQLYQHMAKSSSSLLPEMSAEENPFRNRLAESEASNDQAPVQIPRDYSEGASGLLRGSANRK